MLVFYKTKLFVFCVSEMICELTAFYNKVIWIIFCTLLT